MPKPTFYIRYHFVKGICLDSKKITSQTISLLSQEQQKILRLLLNRNS